MAMANGDLEDFLYERGYFTINQMVSYLATSHPSKSVSFPTLKRYLLKGFIRYDQVGGQYRIPKTSVDQYVRYGTAPPPESTPEPIKPDL